MRHHAFAAAMGLFTAAALVPCGQSFAAGADPTGYWVKPNSERNAKIQISKCGRGLCSKIIWLEDPNDSHGKPLRDIRNENPSLRGRSIVGLPIFSNLQPSAPGAWAGQIYNPEDGHTYSVTLTVVSKKELRLRGCKNWLMCAERTWLRTSPPPQAKPAEEPQIEASAGEKPAPVALAAREEPSAPVEPASHEAAPVETAVAAPAPAPTVVAQPVAAPVAPIHTASAAQQAAPALQSTFAAKQPAMPQAQASLQSASLTTNDGSDPNDGYRFLTVSATPDTARLSGENVSSMFTMTRPLASSAAPAPAQTQAAAAASQPVQSASLADDPVPLPAQKPKVMHRAPIEASAGGSLSKPASPVQSSKPQSAPAPQDETAGTDAQPAQEGQSLAAEEAETAQVDSAPMTRRQKRLLRRQHRQPLLPWLQ